MPSRTPLGYAIYAIGVGITLFVYLLGCGRPRIANGQMLIPRFHYVVMYNEKFVRFGYLRTLIICSMPTNKYESPKLAKNNTVQILERLLL